MDPIPISSFYNQFAKTTIPPLLPIQKPPIALPYLLIQSNLSSPLNHNHARPQNRNHRRRSRRPHTRPSPPEKRHSMYDLRSRARKNIPQPRRNIRFASTNRTSCTQRSRFNFRVRKTFTTRSRSVETHETGWPNSLGRK